MKDEIQLTRQELYDRVFELSLARLAERWRSSLYHRPTGCHGRMTYSDRVPAPVADAVRADSEASAPVTQPRDGV